MNFLKNLASDLLDDQEAFTNLTQVACVDVEACLSVLSKRYAKDSIYTHCGPLLVAMNPYNVLPELYSPDVLEEHLQLVSAAPRLPHIFDMAARVYSELMASGADQAVIISGESGAGKTENAKFLMRFFAEAACSTGDGLHERVMGTNPIMESFGCAQTIRNDNSSRFGKFVQLQFTQSGRLSAARIQTYLLEKSRVVQISTGECNFHIFYETLAGLSSAQAAAYRTPESSLQCAYLHSGSDVKTVRDPERDRDRFFETGEAFAAFGVDQSLQASISQLLSAIMHMGNLHFGDKEQATIDDDASWASLDAACHLLQTDPAKVRDGMCLRRMKAGAEWVTTNNTTSQASDVRHALAKQLYSALFEWVVSTLNTALRRDGDTQGERPGPSIGCVDIFGFESFPTNSLEQLCINFANERLQRLFVGVLFEASQAEYDKEGVQVDPIDFSDNKAIVELIGDSPMSLMTMLTEECVFPKGSDVLYLQKACRTHSKHPHFHEIKTSATSFCLRHFAGDVTYNVSGFLTKNKDPVSQDLSVLMQRSRNTFVSMLLQQQAAAACQPATARLKSSKFYGVVDHFRASLKSLISTLQAAELHFVRCIKPNDDKAAGMWEKSVVSRQLHSSGIVHAVQASRSGYSDHMLPTQIVAQFGIFAGVHDTPGSPFDGALAVLTACGVQAEEYAVGHTKVFLRDGVLADLQRQRLTYASEHAASVQAAMRGHIGRQQVRTIRKARAQEEQARLVQERQRREEAERRRADEERRRAAEEAEARRLEAEEIERRRTVQKARSLSFEKRRKKASKEKEEKDRLAAQAVVMAAESSIEARAAKKADADERQRQRLVKEGVIDASSPVPQGESFPQAESSLEHAAPEEDDHEWVGAAVVGGMAEPKARALSAVSALPPVSVPRQEAASSVAPPTAADVNGQFVCPFEDVVAYAAYIGMDVQADVKLLWIADEALQATEPVGWEERQDPDGGIYYLNTITGMTMLQNPVDFHYQQMYLQTKQQQQQRQAKPQSSYKLDLRSVDSDDTGSADPGTPVGWVKRTKSLLTPRSLRAPSSSQVTFVQVTASVQRHPSERLGLELNAYNQVLSVVPGSACDRAPDVHIHDRVLSVDGETLGDRLLSDVLQLQENHIFILERCMPMATKAAGPGSPRGLRNLLTPRRSSASGPGEHSSPAKPRSGKKPPLPPGSPAAKFDRFRVVIKSGVTVLGLVCDEASVVVDMVPGSVADVQRMHATPENPQLQIGDRIVCVDGLALGGTMSIDDLLTPAEEHSFLVERLKLPIPASPKRSLSSRMMRVLTPRGTDEEASSKPADIQPTRALREVKLYKTDNNQRLGIRFVRDDEGFDQEFVYTDAVQPIVAALDPAGEAAAAGLQVDDMVLSINGQTGLSNTQAAAQLRELTGEVSIVVRRATWMGEPSEGVVPETPRAAMRRLV